MMRRLQLILGILLLVVSSACSRPSVPFSLDNARAHIGMLAGTIGSRPVGTPANAKARAYVVDQLRLYGYDVRVQEVDARRPEIGQTTRVSNIIAIRAGKQSEAIGIMSHYDSVPFGPGAADDALGVGISLEAARVLSARADRRWSLMILVTDGEEAGLMGAAGLVTDREVMDRLKAYVNIEAIGSAGSPRLFETGPGNGWLVAPWARSAPRPRGASFGIEVYKRLPNDTDFSILKRHEIPGLNFAAVDDSYPYHTTRDTPDRLSNETILGGGEQVVAVVTALDNVDITQRSAADRTYFDIGGRSAISYGPAAWWTIAGLSLSLGIIAWVRVVGETLRVDGLLRWILTAIWTLLGSAAVVGSMVGVTWALRAAREVYHPWYARPGRLFALMLAVGVVVGWGFVRLGYWLPAKAHCTRRPALVWSVALPAWIALAAAMAMLAPGAAYWWLVPLGIAGLLLTVVPPSQSVAVRVASLVVLVACAVLWIQPVLALLYFVVAILGRMPVVTPIFIYAALMSVAAMMIAPPFIAVIMRSTPLVRPSIATALFLFAVAGAAGYAYLAPAYTHEQPLHRAARAIQDGDGPAVWDIGSVEPGLDLDAGAPSGWIAATTDPTAPIPVRRLPHPFVFRATGPSLGPAPFAVTTLTVDPVQAGTELGVTVQPRQPGLEIAFVLPEGLEPARASLPGVVRRGRWTATYIAPPAEGVALRATFGQIDAARLRDLRVMATATGPGDGSGWQPPPWLPQARMAWTARATWIVAPFALPAPAAGASAAVAPTPALR